MEVFTFLMEGFLLGFVWGVLGSWKKKSLLVIFTVLCVALLVLILIKPDEVTFSISGSGMSSWWWLGFFFTSIVGTMVGQAVGEELFNR